MSVNLLTEHHFECLNLKEGCKGSSESKLVKIPHCLEYMSRIKYACMYRLVKESFVCDFQSTLIHCALLSYKEYSYKLQLFSMSRACDFQQCGILTSVDSDEPVHPTFKLRNSQ